MYYSKTMYIYIYMSVPRYMYNSNTPQSCQQTNHRSPLAERKSHAGVLQRSRVGESLTLVLGQLHLVCGKGPAAVRITVHLNNGWLQAEVVAHLQRMFASNVRNEESSSQHRHHHHHRHHQQYQHHHHQYQHQHHHQWPQYPFYSIDCKWQAWD